MTENWKYEVIREGEDIIIKVDCEKFLRAPSLEDDNVYMSHIIDTLLEVPNATKIVLYQKRNY